jgi:hypothetical protein
LPSHSHFEIDIISALSGQLVSAFAKLEVGPLEEAEIAGLPKGQGVYQLHHKGKLVYIGKASGLKQRLGEHREKITGRRNIDVGTLGYKCLLVHPNWTTLAPEDSLIKFYRKSGGGECPWNGNGFGPHDPGRERETTNKPPDGFDAQYPIRDDWPCPWITPGDYTAYEILKSLKQRLPYLLRFQTAASRSQKPHPDHLQTVIRVPHSDLVAHELLKLIAMSLPGWQGTVFPSHFILYKEDCSYKHGRVVWPSAVNSA